MARQVHIPEHLRVIEGGRAQEKRRGFARMAVIAAGIAACGVSAGLLNLRAQGNAPGELLAGRGTARIARPLQVDEELSPSKRLEKLGNRELIGRMADEGTDLSGTRPIEHNLASLILEMRGEGAVADMTDALAHDPSPMRRAAIAYSLGRMGLESALPALRQAAADPSQPVRKAAEYAIGSIEAKGGR